MCQARRRPHVATSTGTSHRRVASPSPTSAVVTAIATKPSPQATSTTATRPIARAMSAVTVITTAAVSRPTARTVSTSPAPDWRQVVRPADEVEAPDTDDLLAHEVGEPAEVGLEALEPARHRQHVVLAQRVDVAHLEPPALEVRDGLADGPHVHVRRDERLDERATAGPLAGAGHLLDQHPSPG